MLMERYPIAPYIHMWQMASGTDPFERKAGWSKSKIENLVSDSVGVIKHYMDTYPGEIRSFSCRVNVSSRDRMIAEGLLVQDPYEICGTMGPALSLKQLINRGRIIETAFFIFDRGERFMQPFKQLWL